MTKQEIEDLAALFALKFANGASEAEKQFLSYFWHRVAVLLRQN